MEIEKDEVLDFMDKLVKSDDSFMKIHSFYKALSDYMEDYDFLKDKKGLTQKEIAAATGTKQSAVSRFESLESNPSYKVLNNMTEAVGGELMITPMADMTIRVPYDLQDNVRENAQMLKMSTHDYLLKIIKKGIHDNIVFEPMEFWFKDICKSKIDDFDMAGNDEFSHICNLEMAV